MKIFNVTRLYPSYITNFYRQNPDYHRNSYQFQKTKLIADGAVWFDSWGKALEKYGYVTDEALANVHPLQLSWAKEQGYSWNKRYWQKQVAVAQIIRFKPDILFLEDWSFFSAGEVLEIRQACPSICSVISWCGAPYDDLSVFSAHNIVLSCIPELVQIFRNSGHRSYHLNHAFDPDILDLLPKKKIDDVRISFTGQIERGKKKHARREALLLYLSKHYRSLKIFTPSADISWQASAKTGLKQAAFILNLQLRKISNLNNILDKVSLFSRVNAWQYFPIKPVNSNLKPHLRSPIFGVKMYQLLRDSTVTLNSHIDVSTHSASNMRLFEATGVGGCLLTDVKTNLSQLFELDAEIVAYDSFEECSEKIRWLLDNPQKRNSIAEAAQKRVLKSHTFAYRAVQLDEIIRSSLSSS